MMQYDIEQSREAAPRRDLHVSRRAILVGGGATLTGVTLLGSLFDTARGQQIQYPGAVTRYGGTKPIYVAEARTPDPVAHSLAENLFWTDILMEHAKFFVMLMPGPELAGQRAQAEQFQATFAHQFEKARSAYLDRSNMATFNQSTIEMVKPFIDFRHRMREAQESGRLQSLVWPLFFDHTAREAGRFVYRLGQLSRGNIELERREVVEFWTRIMFDHMAFIAHLLDPQEVQLIEKANQTAWVLRNLLDQPPLPLGLGGNPVLAMAQEVVDFKTAAERGINTGQIKSIIHPTLADHVRREAVKFVDELIAGKPASALTYRGFQAAKPHSIPENVVTALLQDK